MWYFAQHGSQQGPVSLEEIQALIDKGTITSATLVWKRGMDNWLAIAETELKDLLPDDVPPPIPVDNPPPIPIEKTKDESITSQKIELGRLLSDSFSYVGSVYTSMLVFFTPNLLINILIAFAWVDGSAGVFFLLSLISYTCIIPFISGASIFYVQRNLIQQGVTIADSMQRATEKFTQLVLAAFLLCLILIPAFICLILPGVYLSIRLSFIYYAVMIENRGAIDALSRSWSLTKGYWGQIFMAFLMLSLVVGLPAAILNGILGVMFGEISPVISQSLRGFIGLIIGPILAVYYVFLFMSLVNLASERGRDGRYI
jgi:hypothetical protein